MQIDAGMNLARERENHFEQLAQLNRFRVVVPRIEVGLNAEGTPHPELDRSSEDRDWRESCPISVRQSAIEVAWGIWTAC
jgi:hypothetical protein